MADRKPILSDAKIKASIRKRLRKTRGKAVSAKRIEEDVRKHNRGYTVRYSDVKYALREMVANGELREIFSDDYILD